MARRRVHAPLFALVVVLFAILGGPPAAAWSAVDEVHRAIECDRNLNYRPMLRENGHDVCVITYPNRGFGDQQESAEFVAHAVLRVHQRSGRGVDVVGHSQGAILPRWAVKYWGSAQRVVDDLVMLAGPQHGFASAHLLVGPRPAPFWQWRFDSAFMRALNSGDETPGDVDYTSIYSAGDAGRLPRASGRSCHHRDDRPGSVAAPA